MRGGIQPRLPEARCVKYGIGMKVARAVPFSFPHQSKQFERPSRDIAVLRDAGVPYQLLGSQSSAGRQTGAG